MIQVINLSKTFGGRKPVRALVNVNFEIGKGEVLGFVGLNGAGKTTTIRIMAGVITPDSGSVLFNGVDAIKNHDKVADKIAWVPENPVFDPTMSGRDFLIYLSKFNNNIVPKERIDEVLSRVGLLERSKEKIKVYSLGMKRRLALAQAFLTDPEIMLMDEAMNGLDPEGMNLFREAMKNFKNSGGSVLLSSHILTEISSISDRITFIHRGETFQTSSVEELEEEFRSKLGNYTYFELDSLREDELDEICKVFNLNAKFDGRLLWVKDASDEDIGNLNIFLVKKGHRVMQIKRAEFNLENLFLQKIRELEGDRK